VTVSISPMSHRVCPWWIGYLLLSPVRRWMQDPVELLRPYVNPGMTVLEPGPGMGFFTIPLAQLVGDSGRVIAVDVQPKMIAALKRRAGKFNVAERVDARVTSAQSLGVDDLAGRVDFALAFAMVHELPSASRFFQEVSRALKPNALLLLAEPRGHVNDADFAGELAAAAGAGLEVKARPEIRRSHAAVLTKR
jgi:ubiquinone/menaquinone biosynthesis C-methylase UbiE